MVCGRLWARKFLDSILRHRDVSRLNLSLFMQESEDEDDSNEDKQTFERNPKLLSLPKRTSRTSSILVDL